MPLLPPAVESAMISAGIVPGTPYYLSLHNATPGITGANEIIGSGSYVRQSITFGAVSAGVMVSSSSQTFTALGSVPLGCPYFGLWNVVSGGTYMGGGTTTGLSGAIPAGSSITLAIAAITATLS